MQYTDITEGPEWNYDRNINSDYLDNELIREINDIKNSITDLGDGFFKVLRKFENIFFIGTKDGDDSYTVIAAVKMTARFKMNGHNVYEASATKRYDGTFKNAALKLYKFVSNLDDAYIMTDSLQSETMKNIWIGWLDNSLVSDPRIYDVNANELRLIDELHDQHWSFDDSKNHIRILGKF